MASMSVATALMKVAQINQPGGEFEIVEREAPKPGARQVRFKVQACGVCHSDALAKDGAWPGIQALRSNSSIQVSRFFRSRSASRSQK